jgi:hypothetical protein
VQTVLLQYCEDEHALPQKPQFWGSVVVLLQTPPQHSLNVSGLQIVPSSCPTHEVDASASWLASCGTAESADPSKEGLASFASAST